jgi:hypothetical protein
LKLRDPSLFFVDKEVDEDEWFFTHLFLYIVYETFKKI